MQFARSTVTLALDVRRGTLRFLADLEHSSAPLYGRIMKAASRDEDGRDGAIDTYWN